MGVASSRVSALEKGRVTFDQRRRALQAQATRARLDAEIADMQRKEDERRARLRPPATPTLDKMAREGKTMESLEADIAASKAKYEEALADVRSIIDIAVQGLHDSLDKLRQIASDTESGMDHPSPADVQKAEAYLAAHGNLQPLGAKSYAGAAALGNAIATGFGGIFDGLGATVQEKLANLKPPEALSDAMVQAMIDALTAVIGGAQTKVRQGASGGGGRLS